jgi:hypothetical protein
MVNGFTMLNWGEIGNDEYFVPIKAELYDYEYYCLTRKRQALYDKGVDMKDTVFNNSDWFSMDDNITHFCGGMTDKDKVNKPKGTQVEATKWFNPTDKKKEEDEVLVCRACGAEHGPEDEVVLVGGK